MNLPKIFMIGWEFPPFNSGGLGTACQGLTEALASEQVHQTLVLPRQLPMATSYLELAHPHNPFIRQLQINMKLNPYGAFGFGQGISTLIGQNRYSFGRSTMVEEAYDYAQMVGELTGFYEHDLIHAHDWMTFPAALKARSVSKKPALLHVHSTEYDRTLNGHINPAIAEIEEESLRQADRIITVSHYTRNMVIDKYQVSSDRVRVVHNGVDVNQIHAHQTEALESFAFGKKVVIFVGRLTSQKGPDYFIQTASQIEAQVPNVLFVVAGSGDMYEQILLQSASRRLTGKVLFSGFLRDRERAFLYRRADLFMMPSVSEPFGIVALEAAAAHTPVIISNQSGVAEVLDHAIRCDYWDTDALATRAVEILKQPDYSAFLADRVASQAHDITWSKAAGKCLAVYREMMH